MTRLGTLLTVAVLASAALAAAPGRLAAEPVARIAALTPSVPFGQPARLPTADEHAARAGTNDTASALDVSAQQVLFGAALLGGAFALGLAATGSLSTAMGAAGAVVISYAVLP